jgi:signal transduction histidine kinase
MSSAPNVIEFPPARSTLIRARQDEARRGAAEERLRIARELHDVVSYGFATISVQAGVALHVLDERPEQVTEALQAIRSASKEALGELRAILGMLREVDPVESSQSAGRLQRVDVLAASTTAAGVPTSVRVCGTPRSLPVLVDQTAFRIVQESLANVLRHAAGTSATVTLVYDRERLIVEVEDDGPRRPNTNPRASDGSGNGILGMRERVLAVGGELEAGPRAEGSGFRVCARLPVLGRP